MDSESDFSVVSLNSTLDTSAAFATPTTTSTPKPKKNPLGLQGGRGGKVPSPAVQKPVRRKNKPKHMCHLCGRCFVREAAFKDHMRLHQIEDATAKYPDYDSIMANSGPLATATLEEVLASPRGDALQVHECAVIFLRNSLTSFQPFSRKVISFFLGNRTLSKFILPSRLLVALNRQCELILSNKSIRSELLPLLIDQCADAEARTLENFLCEYVLCFTKVLLKCIAETVHGGPWVRRRPHECSVEERQSLHYMGGACLKYLLDKAKRYPTSTFWQKVHMLIETRFKCEDTEASEVDSQWTNDRNKGGLIKIGDKCLEFLVVVAEIIEELEDPQGNLSYSAVYARVLDSMALTVFWDLLIGNVVTERVSFLFLQIFLQQVCSSYGNGISKRRLNDFRERNEPSMNIRHVVAPRPSRPGPAKARKVTP